MPIATCHLLKQDSQFKDIWLYTYIIFSLIVLIAAIVNSKSNILDFSAVAQFSVAIFLYSNGTEENDNFWLLFLLLLFLFNHFVLPYLSRQFSIPQVDLSSMNLVFLNTFLINAFSRWRILTASVSPFYAFYPLTFLSKNVVKQEPI